MSVIYTVAAAPKQTAVPDPEQLASFVADLIADHVIGFPACVLAGHLAEADEEDCWPGPFAITNATPRIGPLPPVLAAERFRLVVQYQGSDPDRLLTAVRAAPIGVADVCVYFTSRHYPPSEGVRADEMPGCDAGVFVTCTTRPLLNVAKFALRPGLLAERTRTAVPGYLAGIDPFDLVPGQEARRTFPAGRLNANWFLMLEGREAWDLLPAVLPACTRHFGADHFAGLDVW